MFVQLIISCQWRNTIHNVILTGNRNCQRQSSLRIGGKVHINIFLLKYINAVVTTIYHAIFMFMLYTTEIKIQHFGKTSPGRISQQQVVIAQTFNREIMSDGQASAIKTRLPETIVSRLVVWRQQFTINRYHTLSILFQSLRSLQYHVTLYDSDCAPAQLNTI